MRRILSLALGLMLGGGPAVAAGPDRWAFEEKEEVPADASFRGPGQAREVAVDNVWGSIAVEGADIRDVELVIRKTIRARNEARLARAKSEVNLEIKDNAPIVEVYVDGPFRCREGDRHGIEWTATPATRSSATSSSRSRAAAPSRSGPSPTATSASERRGAFDVRNVNAGSTSRARPRRATPMPSTAASGSPSAASRAPIARLKPSTARST